MQLVLQKTKIKKTNKQKTKKSVKQIALLQETARVGKFFLSDPRAIVFFGSQLIIYLINNFFVILICYAAYNLITINKLR